MDRSDFLQRIQRLRVWRQHGRRAPHKPLLLLYAMGCLLGARQARIPFAQVERDLGALLRDYGPPNPTDPVYPFYHLASDGLWDHGIPANLIPAKGPPRKTELRTYAVAGGLRDEVIELLRREPDLVAQAATELVEAHFAPSIQDEVLQATGLERGVGMRRQARRDPRFREAVLDAYGHRCAVCGFDLAIGANRIGLEGAHVRWVQADGPDVIPNGLGLCVLHHRLFDLGIWRLDPDLRLYVSDRLNGTSAPAQRMLALHGQQIAAPVHREQFPDPAYLAWHHREVFKGNDRPLDG